MKKQKLTYRFHNPNPSDAMIDYLIKFFVEVNMEKADQAIQAASQTSLDTSSQIETERPA